MFLFGGNKMPMPKGFKYSEYKRVDKICQVCGKNFTVKPSEHNNGHGKFCSYKCMGIFRSQLTRDKNPNWKGGNWFNKSKDVKIRDNYTCKICKLREPDIMETHHIKSKKTHPELKLEDINLITLCPNCHKRITIKELKMKKDKAKKSIEGVSIWKK